MSDLKVCYNILSQVYKQQAYGSISLTGKLGEAENRDFVTRLVYGVLQNDVKYDYYIGRMTAKKPQNSAIILLKIGMYCIDGMDSMPDYAAVNNVVELTKEIGKQGSSGFINGVLKAFCRQRPALPTEASQRLSVEASVPLWIVKNYIRRFGAEKTREFLTCAPFELEHARVNLLRTDKEKVLAKLVAAGVDCIDDPRNADCFFVRNCQKSRQLFDAGEITFQSLTSVECCKTAAVRSGDNVLDMCAAPGGKSVYFAGAVDGVKVLSCDVYHHRLELIQQYARRMGVRLDVRLMDATVYNKALEGAYDVVLCDVPCSGFGVAAKKPDVYLFKDKDKIFSLTQTQSKILENGARYVKAGGTIVYSTCTLMKEENEDIVKKFLKSDRRFTLESQHTYLPDGKGTDGFFVAKMRREKA